MKKKLLLFTTLLLPIITSKAYVNIDGIYYNLDSQTKTAEVTYGPSHRDNVDAGQFEVIRDFYYTGDIVIPETVVYDNVKYKVTTIIGVCDHVAEDTYVRYPSAFENCAGLTSVTIPRSVTCIGRQAFAGCSGLQKVIVPDIDAWCAISFENMTSNPLYYAKHLYSSDNTIITDLVIPSNVTSIGSYAFYNCSDLTSITIPSSVSSIGRAVFENTPWFNSQPDGLVYAGLVAYKYKGTMQSNTSIVVNDGTKGVAGDAFSSCRDLTSVILPNSITSIGSYAFQGCSGLTSITISNGITTIEQGTFSGCSSLTNVIIPESVISIGNSAFIACSGLASMIIPNSVTSIGSSAFERCSGLTSVSIPCSVTSIGSSPFSGCNNLTTITINTKEIGSWFSSIKSIKEINLGEKVISIGENAFQYCSGLTSMILPNSVTSIGLYAFQGCTGLNSITLSNSLKTIDSYAFRNCSGISSIILPSSISSINSYAFEGCSSLTAVSIPKSVRSLGNRVFAGCSGLTSVSLFCSPNIFGKDVFDKCENVIEITLDWETISSIPLPLTKISKVVLRENVKNIAERAFANIDKLNDVYCYSTDVPIADRTSFENSYVDYVTLHVPSVSVDKYKSTALWSGFKEIVPIEGTETDFSEQCETPTISFVDGKMKFDCETEGVEYNYKINANISLEGKGNEVPIPSLTISVYASKDGYEDSDVVTKDISLSSSGINVDVNGDGVINAADIVAIANMIMSSK